MDPLNEQQDGKYAKAASDSSSSSDDEGTISFSIYGSQHQGDRKDRKGGELAGQDLAKAAHLMWAPTIMAWLMATQGVSVKEVFKVWAAYVKHWGSREDRVGIVCDAVVGLYVVPCAKCDRDIALDSKGQGGIISQVIEDEKGAVTVKVHWIWSDKVCGPYAIPNRWDILVEQEDEDTEAGIEFTLAVATESDIERCKYIIEEREWAIEAAREAEFARLQSDAQKRDDLILFDQEEDPMGISKIVLEASVEMDEGEEEDGPDADAASSKGAKSPIARANVRDQSRDATRGNRRYQPRKVYKTMMPRQIVPIKTQADRPFDEMAQAYKEMLNDHSRVCCRLLRDKEVNSLPGAVRSTSLVPKGSVLILPTASPEATSDLQTVLETSQTVTVCCKDHAAGESVVRLFGVIKASFASTQAALQRKSVIQYKSLNALCLQRVPMTVSEVKILVHGLLWDPACHIQTLYLTRNGFTDQHTREFCHAFRSRSEKKTNPNSTLVRFPLAKSLRQVCLLHNGVTDRGVDFLVKAAMGNPVLERLDLSGNDIFDGGAQNICRLLKSKTMKLEFVSLTDCRIGDLGKQALRNVCKRTRASPLHECGVVFGPSTQPTLARRKAGGPPSRGDTPPPRRDSFFSPYHQEDLVSASQAGIGFAGTGSQFGQAGGGSQHVDPRDYRARGIEGGGSPLAVLPARRPERGPVPPELMSNREKFTNEFFTSQTARGIAALKDKERLMRQHVLEYNRTATERDLRARRLTDMKSARDRLRSEIVQVKETKPEGWEGRLERMQVELEWFVKDLQKKRKLHGSETEENEKRVIEMLYLQESVVPPGSCLTVDQVKPPDDYTALFMEACGELKVDQELSFPWHDYLPEDCITGFEFSKATAHRSIRIDQGLAIAEHEGSDGDWHCAMLLPEIREDDGSSYAEFLISMGEEWEQEMSMTRSSARERCHMMVGLAYTPRGQWSSTSDTRDESEDSLYLYSVDGSLCFRGHIGPGAEIGYGLGDTVGVLLELPSGTVRFFVNNEEVLETSIPSFWKEGVGKNGCVIKFAIDFGVPGQLVELCMNRRVDREDSQSSGGYSMESRSRSMSLFSKSDVSYTPKAASGAGKVLHGARKALPPIVRAGQKVVAVTRLMPDVVKHH